jgi:ABC-type transport system involved in multi-copper enzyme maturation permease subunit
MTSLSWTRVSAVIRKELTEFRRNRLIVITMAIFPVIFVIAPTAQLFAAKVNTDNASNPLMHIRVGLTVLYLMMMPVAVPTTVSGYSIVGERDQGTLEPLLTTPVTRTELILGKAAAIFLPAIGISYLMFGIFVAVIRIGANATLASVVLHAPQLWAGLVFAPLLCFWSIWVGLAISSKVSDSRVAQQLTLLGSLPPLALVALFAFQVIDATLTIAFILGGSLLIVDLLSWIFVAKLFDRERLVIGSAPKTEAPPTIIVKVPAS